MNEWLPHNEAWREVGWVFISNMCLLHLNGSPEIPDTSTGAIQGLPLDQIISTTVLGNS